MGAKALVSDQVHTLIRRNTATGSVEKTVYVGSLRNKPAGWRVDHSVPAARAMAQESGLA